VLETLGVLRTEPGLGTFVAESEQGELRPWSFASRYSLQEIYQFRFVAEGYAARLAAMRVTDTDVVKLGEILSEHRRAVRTDDPVAAAHHDFEFHQVIMEYSGNKVFVDMHASYRKALLESQYLPTRRKDRQWEPIVEHENILRTLAHRDPEGASYFMHVHITRAADRVGIMLSDAL
jgi:GntR family transcriptional regulator, transcriptional repressor for pyruvate dehydrogenase complex